MHLQSHTHTQTHAHKSLCTRMFICAEARGQPQLWLTSHSLVFEQGLSVAWHSPSDLNWLMGEPQPSVSTSAVLGLQAHTIMTDFLHMGAHLGLHTSAANTLLTEHLK